MSSMRLLYVFALEKNFERVTAIQFAKEFGKQDLIEKCAHVTAILCTHELAKQRHKATECRTETQRHRETQRDTGKQRF